MINTLCVFVFVFAGSGIRQRGGQDGVLARVSPENTTSCQYFHML